MYGVQNNLNYSRPLLPVLCTSSIGQIINQFVCVSVSEWVGHSKRVERSTGRNFPPIFTKLATVVVSQEMWSPIVFGGDSGYLCPTVLKWKCGISFYSARNARIASAVLATAIPSVCLSVCPSVCLSHAGIVSKRRHVARCSFHRWIAKCV